jgi:RND family efflux transporter MFP subunit
VPFDGVVVAKYVENFEDIGLKQAIMRIVDDTHIEMIINLPEDLISLASRVKTVNVVFDPFPEHTLIATVKEIGTEASAKTRTYPVTLIMDQPEDIKILPGMAGKTKGADIEDVEELNLAGLEVPLSALFTSGESRDTYVWIINDQSNTVSKRKVITDRLTDHGQIVTEGLEPGELIATAGVHYLKEGQKIRILQSDAE